MSIKARIFRPTRTAMQSGKALTRNWILEFDASDAKFVEPLMGWVGSRDTRRQLRLYFPSEEAAREFAAAKGIECISRVPHDTATNIHPYAENFSAKRREYADL